MSWARIDDRLYDHPKVLAAGTPAMGLWVRCLSYCAAHLTDGFVPESVVFRMVDSRSSLPNRLESAGLWHRDSSRAGWVLHDYLEFQASRSDVLKQREDRRKAGEAGAAKRWQTDSSCHAFANPPIPSHPLPSIKPLPPSGVSPLEVSVRKTGSRLAADWEPKPGTLERFLEREKYDASKCIETFKNYWLAKAGKDATKLDWELTFINWVLRDIANAKSAASGKSARPPWKPAEPPEPPYYSTYTGQHESTEAEKREVAERMAEWRSRKVNGAGQ